MTWEDLANKLRTAVAAVAAAENPPLDVQYDNAKFTKPENKIWARATILPGQSNQAEIGGATGGTFRDIGMLVIQIFCPKDAGDGDALVLCDKFKLAFRSKIVSGVTLLTPYPIRMGLVGPEWQINVNCPYQCDDVVADQELVADPPLP